MRARPNLLLPFVLVITAALGATATNACSSSEDPGGSSGTDGGASSGQLGSDSGGRGDGGGGGDGGGVDAPVGDGGSGCVDTATKVCDDFDRAPTIDAKWTTAAGGGTAAIVAQGLSAPNALAVVVSTAGGVVYIEKELPFSTKFRCEMDMLLEALPSQGDLDLFSITTKTSTGDYYVYFAHSTAGFLLGEFSEQLPGGGNVDKKQPITAPPSSAWFRVVLDNDGANATLTVNGATTSLTGLAQPPGTTRNVQVGAPFSQSTEKASRVLYDNVICTSGN